MDERAIMARAARVLRVAAGMTLRQVAQGAGCSHETVRSFELQRFALSAPTQTRILRATGADDETVALAVQLVERLAHTEAHDGH